MRLLLIATTISSVELQVICFIDLFRTGFVTDFSRQVNPLGDCFQVIMLRLFPGICRRRSYMK